MLFTSCSDESVIFYEYNGVTVTRVENGNQNYFYYGRFDKGEYPDNYIKSEHSGLNSDMGAYLIFQANKKVEIIRLAAIFNIEKAPPSLCIRDNQTENLKFWKWKDSLDNINGSYDNVIEVTSGLNIEQERNKKNQTKVMAVYP